MSLLSATWRRLRGHFGRGDDADDIAVTHVTHLAASRQLAADLIRDRRDLGLRGADAIEAAVADAAQLTLLAASLGDSQGRRVTATAHHLLETRWAERTWTA